MTAPLTPESEALREHLVPRYVVVEDAPLTPIKVYDEELRVHLAAIEAAAIARYSEGRADECCSGCEEPSGHRGIPEGAGGLVHQERGEP
jgi:hypothetical protein